MAWIDVRGPNLMAARQRVSSAALVAGIVVILSIGFVRLAITNVEGIEAALLLGFGAIALGVTALLVIPQAFRSPIAAIRVEGDRVSVRSAKGAFHDHAIESTFYRTGIEVLTSPAGNGPHGGSARALMILGHGGTVHVHLTPEAMDSLSIAATGLGLVPLKIRPGPFGEPGETRFQFVSRESLGKREGAASSPFGPPVSHPTWHGKENPRLLLSTLICIGSAVVSLTIGLALIPSQDLSIWSSNTPTWALAWFWASISIFSVGSILGLYIAFVRPRSPHEAGSELQPRST